jgi:Mn-dependent DtxR family transcriptional regulator
MSIHESAENYLETIHVLHRQYGAVRSIDVANYLDFSRPSVSVALKNLRNQDLVTVDDLGNIRLTTEGQTIASVMYERHRLFTDWLVELGVDPTIAEKDACRVEHVLSAESFSAIKKAIQKGQKEELK